MVAIIFFVKNHGNPVEFKEYVTGWRPVDGTHIVANIQDLTTNFLDLGRWSSEDNLDKTSRESAIRKLTQALDTLYQAGYRAYDKETPDEFQYAPWEFGHRHSSPESKCASCVPTNLEYDDRMAILVYHLKNLLKTCKDMPQGVTLYWVSG